MDTKFVFFGTPKLAVAILEELKLRGITPALVVTAPDTPQGRGLALTPPPAKVWAKEEGIEVAQPEAINSDFVNELGNTDWDFFVVAAYGHMLPQELLDLPKKGILNVHPSLLPKLRGASPIQSAILTDAKDAIGVTIMLLDEKTDHGPILSQARIEPEEWPMRASILENVLAHVGGEMLAETIPLWMSDSIAPEEQNHSEATFCNKIKKEDGQLNLSDTGLVNIHKIYAFEGWPGTYFFAQKGDKNVRVKVIEATLDDGGALLILRVIPEGKKEMAFKDFLRGGYSIPS